MTKFQLISAFLNRTPITIYLKSGRIAVYRVIDSIQHEDDSGSSFIVTGQGRFHNEPLEMEHYKLTVYFRTVD